MRKKILAFDYMQVGPLLAIFCKSRTLCEKKLYIWRAKDKWLGKYFESFVAKDMKNILMGTSFVSTKPFGTQKHNVRSL